MRSKTLMALAVASSFACASAFAGGMHHSSQMSSEVQTPSSVSESAPWLTGQPHLAAWGSHDARTSIGFQQGQFSDGPVGTSSGTSGMGSVGYDSMSGASDLSMSDAQAIDSGDSVTVVEYWLLGADPGSVGMSSSEGASGSVGFDSTDATSGGYDSSISDAQMIDSGDSVATIEYWLLDGDPNSIGTTSSTGGSGTVGFDSSISGSGTADLNLGEPLAVVYTLSAERVAETIGEATPLLSEHYLIHGPLSQAASHSVIVLEVGPAHEDVALLDSLSRDFYVLTAAYDEG